MSCYEFTNSCINVCSSQVLKPSGSVTNILQTMLMNPVPVVCNFRQLIGFDKTSVIPWERVGQVVNAAETEKLVQLSACTCGVDPTTVCVVHTCKCERCKVTPSGAGCAWRSHAVDFIAKHLQGAGTVHSFVQAATYRLTYMQVVELYGGIGPHSPRERNLLNLLAMLPELQPLGYTCGVCDKSKNINMTGLRCDGTVGTMLTTASMWSFDDGSLAGSMWYGYGICPSSCYDLKDHW